MEHRFHEDRERKQSTNKRNGGHAGKILDIHTHNTLYVHYIIILHYRIFYIQIQICKYNMIISDDHCQGGTARVAPGSATLATLQQPEDAARRMEAWNLELYIIIITKSANEAKT